MNICKTVAVAASMLTLTAAAIGISTPASAQNWHHDRGNDWHHGPVYRHYQAPVYHTGPHFYHRRPVITEWNAGPGYVRRDWSWYNNQPGRWRATHPYRYHGSKASGIWIRL